MHSNIPIIALQLIYIFNFIFPLLPRGFSTGLVAKPGCQDRCGNLSIPYPFGVGSGCALDSSFTISCNTFTDPPKAYLSNIFNIQVIEINETYIRVRYPYLISACYDLSDYHSGTGLNVTTDSYKHSMNVNLSGTPYSLSSWNQLTAIGCDDVVLQPNGSYVSGGCSAVCTDKNDTGGVGYCPYNATSLGNGCCQAYISSGTTFLRAQLIDLSGKFVRRKLFPCSYAFVMERRDSNETVFSYPLYYLDNSSTLLNDNWASTTRLPVVRLDWKIGAENCSQAKLNPNTYACRDEKSVCVGLSDLVQGYQCSCVPGYEGNPYLTGGCRAISFSSTIAKVGCPDQCGKLSIPFPFGVGRHCYLEPSFEIICNTSTNPPKPYLRVLNKEIVELNSSQVMVNYPNLGLACYHLSDYDRKITKTDERSLVIDLWRTQYTLSDQNWITAIGCDDMVVGIFGHANQSFIRSGCANVCWNRQLYPSYHYGYCPDGTTSSYWPGDGCCRTPVPSGTTYLEANLSDLSGRWPRTNFSCSYAFVQHIDDQSLVDYPIFDNSTGITLDDLLRRLSETKVTLDWRIGAVNCEAAQRNLATFACKGNTTCVDFDATVGGYLCNCSVGYQGNPYLTPGCRDGTSRELHNLEHLNLLLNTN
ncbi:hypothetical protein C2S51_006666 [Perilla frutescens var. frutescens]|nr:hypothetical protein C2S51_006666 [Perilla frutescens var. frutescens]